MLKHRNSLHTSHFLSSYALTYVALKALDILIKGAKSKFKGAEVGEYVSAGPVDISSLKRISKDIYRYVYVCVYIYIYILMIILMIIAIMIIIYIYIYTYIYIYIHIHNYYYIIILFIL